MDWRDLVRFSKTLAIHYVVGDRRGGEFDKPIARASRAGIESLIRYERSQVRFLHAAMVVSVASRPLALWMMKTARVLKAFSCVIAMVRASRASGGLLVAASYHQPAPAGSVVSEVQRWPETPCGCNPMRLARLIHGILRNSNYLSIFQWFRQE